MARAGPLREEHDLQKEAIRFLFRSKADIFEFLETRRGAYAVTPLCALYGVTPAGYYAWRRRPESAHAGQDRRLTQRITALFRAHRGRYGSPRIHRALRAEGWRVCVSHCAAASLLPW